MQDFFFDRIFQQPLTSLTLKVCTNFKSKLEEFLKFQIERNSPIFAYYGFAKELSLNLSGDNPFQVIIGMQQLMLANRNSSTQGQTCAMAYPAKHNGINYTNISN